MTYENAVYLKITLLCGYKDELWAYVDQALVEQDPLSDVVLELSTAGSDDKKLLSVLNEHLLKIRDSDIDYNKTVFDLVMSFLKRKYVEDSMSMADITSLMYRIAVYTERYLDEPWHTMYFMGDIFAEAEAGVVDKEDYQRIFDAFLNEGICFCDYPSPKPKESILKRIIEKLLGK